MSKKKAMPREDGDKSQSGESVAFKAFEARKLEAEILQSREKHLLECQKLEAEIGQIRRPLWKRHEFYSALVPIIVALTTILITWKSGWLDAKQAKLDAQKISLDYDVKKLADAKTFLTNEISTLTNQLSSLAKRLERRVFSDAQKEEFKKSLKQAPKFSVGIAGVASDNESMSFAEKLKELLDDCGYPTVEYIQPLNAGDSVRGIIFSFRTNVMAGVSDLTNAFLRAGLQIKVEAQSHHFPDSDCSITIGVKD
jgi:hypothetical protein